MSKKAKWQPSQPLANKKYELTVRAYLANGMKKKQAALDAGYSEGSAERQATRIFSDDKVLQRINFLQRDRLKKLDIDADYVLLNLVEILEMDIADIFDDDNKLLPVSEMPKAWRKFLTGIENTELFEGYGEEREQVGFLKKVRWIDKMKALEWLGKHVDVQAFKERVEHGGKISHNHDSEQLRSFADRVAKRASG